MTTETTNVLRTEFDGAYEIYENYWGKYLRKCRDPEANALITEEHLNKFEVNPNVQKIPSAIWTAWILLCFHYVDKVPSKMEVLVRFLRSESDPNQFIAIIPRQNVTSASAKSHNFADSCNLLTGEKYTSYPPEGYIPVGSSHSHNDMWAGWSPEDNTSEIPDPGIHLTVGRINTKTMQYEVAASVTANLRRFVLTWDQLIETEFQQDVTFHENVLEYVDTNPPKHYPYNKNWVKPFNYNKKLGNTQRFKEYSHGPKRLPPARNHFSNLEEYQEYMYGDFLSDFSQTDPFYFSETSSLKLAQPIEPHNLIDMINDYINNNSNDSDKLEEFKQQLSSSLIDLELFIQS